MTNTTAARSLPTQFCTSNTEYRAIVRTRFCTSKGWFRYSDLTKTMRKAILSAEDGVGSIAGWVSTDTVRKLEAMGLVESYGVFARLTHHGETLWLELGAA